MTNLQTRIVSAIGLAAVVLVLAWLGGPWFRLVAAVMTVAIAYEWVSICRAQSGRAESEAWRTPVVLLSAALAAALLAGVSAGWLWSLLLAGTAVLVVLDGRLGMARGWAAGGFVYAGASGLALGLLRADAWHGLVAIVFLFGVVWSTDILAYFVGRAVGGPKLAPRISPGKTRSGALGGAVGGVIAGVAVAAAFGGGRLAFAAGTALLLSILSQAGDLFESWVKRRHGVKDSGRIIPGHGGVMDRVDGLVAAAVALYLIGSVAGGIDDPARALFVN